MRKKLGLPKRLEDLAKLIVNLAEPKLKDDVASLAWNGLTIAENHELFRTRDPVALAALISKGLLHVARKAVAGKLQIELVHGSLTEAKRLDAVAIAALDGVRVKRTPIVVDAAQRCADAIDDGQQLTHLDGEPIERRFGPAKNTGVNFSWTPPVLVDST